MEEDDINFDFEDTLPTQHAGGVRPVPVQAVGAAGHEHARALALTDQGPSTSGRHFRQTVCTYWLKGLCMKGEDCGFLHEFDTARMPVCRNLIRYGECRDTDCPFKHAMDDLKECNMYKLGFCVYGAHCRYRHTRVPGPPPDPATLDAVRPRHSRPGGWGDGTYMRRPDASGPRPPAVPRPSAADLSSGRVPEPKQQPQRQQQQEPQQAQDEDPQEQHYPHPDHDQHPRQSEPFQGHHHQQQQHHNQHQFPDHQQLQQQQHFQHLQQQQQQQQQGGMGHFPSMGFQQQGPGPMQMMGMPFGMPMNMQQHPAAFRPFGMGGPMGPMLGPGGQPMGQMFPNPMQMQMQMQMMRPQFMPQQGMPFQH